MTLPTITLNMHQSTYRHYLLVDPGIGFPELITDKQTDWNWARRIANVEVELPEMIWGTSEEVRASINEAAIDEAVKQGLVHLPGM